MAGHKKGLTVDGMPPSSAPEAPRSVPKATKHSSHVCIFHWRRREDSRLPEEDSPMPKKMKGRRLGHTSGGTRPNNVPNATELHRRVDSRLPGDVSEVPKEMASHKRGLTLGGMHHNKVSKAPELRRRVDSRLPENVSKMPKKMAGHKQGLTLDGMAPSSIPEATELRRRVDSRVPADDSHMPKKTAAHKQGLTLDGIPPSSVPGSAELSRRVDAYLAKDMPKMSRVDKETIRRDFHIYSMTGNVIGHHEIQGETYTGARRIILETWEADVRYVINRDEGKRAQQQSRRASCGKDPGGLPEGPCSTGPRNEGGTKSKPPSVLPDSPKADGGSDSSSSTSSTSTRSRSRSSSRRRKSRTSADGDAGCGGGETRAVRESGSSGTGTEFLQDLGRGHRAAAGPPELASASGSTGPPAVAAGRLAWCGSLALLQPPAAKRQLRPRGSSYSSCAKSPVDRAAAAAGGGGEDVGSPSGGTVSLESAAAVVAPGRPDPTAVDVSDPGTAYASARAGGTVDHRGGGVALGSGSASSGSAGDRSRARGAASESKNRKRKLEDGVDDPSPNGSGRLGLDPKHTPEGKAVDIELQAAEKERVGSEQEQCGRDESELERLQREALQKRQEVEDALFIKSEIQEARKGRGLNVLCLGVTRVGEYDLKGGLKKGMKRFESVEREMRDDVNEGNMNPMRDTARVLAMEALGSRVRCISKVYSPAESDREMSRSSRARGEQSSLGRFLDADMASTSRGALLDLIKEKFSGVTFDSVLLDHYWLPDSMTWLNQTYMRNNGGLLQNLVSMTSASLLQDDFEILLPINQAFLELLVPRFEDLERCFTVEFLVGGRLEDFKGSHLAVEADALIPAHVMQHTYGKDPEHQFSQLGAKQPTTAMKVALLKYGVAKEQLCHARFLKLTRNPPVHPALAPERLRELSEAAENAEAAAKVAKESAQMTAYSPQGLR